MSPRAAAKRVYDLGFSALGIVALTPLALLIALAIKVDDGGRVFFRQERVGRGGRSFHMWKFRSMVADAPKLGLLITAGRDPRATRVGRWLRRLKLDELPQLVNVLTGEMSLVGPRPEVPRYVALYSATERRVLEYRPGITDPATLEFRNEEELLATAGNVEEFYVTRCIPRKIQLNLSYAASATMWSDTVIIVRTLLPSFDRAMRRRGTAIGSERTGMPD
ncbi:MAG: hypothetical protein RIR76_1405 [Verrucomicrobiota bacterium]|jgi:lipopolysaccharide/colanic/teichoic acid biosynthesis glycosyltransferase